MELPDSSCYSMLGESDGEALTLSASLAKCHDVVKFDSFQLYLEFLKLHLNSSTSNALEDIFTSSFHQQSAGEVDLHPINRTNHFSEKSVTPENDVHEKKQIQRRTHGWFLRQACRSRRPGASTALVMHRLQVAIQLRWHGDQRSQAATGSGA